MTLNQGVVGSIPIDNTRQIRKWGIIVNNSKKVYIVLEDNGAEYREDRYDWIEKVFSTKEKAEQYKKKKITDCKKLQDDYEYCAKCPVNTKDCPTLKEISAYCKQENPSLNKTTDGELVCYDEADFPDIPNIKVQEWEVLD